MPTSQTRIAPKKSTQKILRGLGDRARDVLTERFGLTNEDQKTLEAIGTRYGITRERVRQIERLALDTLRKSKAFEEEAPLYQNLESILEDFGGIVHEDELLSSLSKDKVTQNHFHFHLVLANETFTKHKDDGHFKARWHIDEKVANHVHDSLHALHEKFTHEHLVSEAEIIDHFINELHTDIAHHTKSPEILKRWLALSKKLSKNPLGEWGRSDSSNIKVRGVKDYAYLIMRKHGSPMHFREVAKEITTTFGRKTHMATCHNELIKDPRFVLVGRGMYALKEWGYRGGVVRDVIRDILDREGAMTKEEIIDRVLKERYLKKNTVLVNLQNPKHFKKLSDGTYTIV